MKGGVRRREQAVCGLIFHAFFRHMFPFTHTHTHTHTHTQHTHTHTFTHMCNVLSRDSLSSTLEQVMWSWWCAHSTHMRATVCTCVLYAQCACTLHMHTVYLNTSMYTMHVYNQLLQRYVCMAALMHTSLVAC